MTVNDLIDEMGLLNMNTSPIITRESIDFKSQELVQKVRPASPQHF